MVKLLSQQAKEKSPTKENQDDFESEDLNNRDLMP